ncbi:MAG: bifunctional (p)ppGpp synthetase/guanosine-3',5'-bis(diphosphate) 3'-pyrophosphohydrolase [Bacillota bacterium]|nr:bifunctional (p)ppGpp synthetase/guanosine-3',5'-bis(diphosphate) 3'-pyrophosphohydrolase [Bacillota bacterium]
MNGLLKKIGEGYKKEEMELLKKAMEFAKNAHRDQKRQSGEPFFSHPYEVADILAELGLDMETIIAGLLHDVIEDTNITLDTLKDEFGPEIAKLVDGVTKLGHFEFKTKEEEQAESLRKMLLAMAKDIRVILIKLADRLHNMRTLEYFEEKKRKEIATETLEIYAPLAHRLGIYAIKAELDDLSLKYVDPQGYNELINVLETTKEQREKSLKAVMDQLKKKLREAGIEAEIEGRPKHLYSIYRKMHEQHKAFGEIYDVIAIRIVVDTVKDCYGALGLVHTMWKPLPGRFKDFIAVPKQNMYQALHTTLIGSDGVPFEVQIRTREMHKTAEYGIAAHWKYKEGRAESSGLDAKLTWLRQLLEWQNDMSDASEFMQTLKIDVFSDEVFVFTPKGDVIDLVKGSTPLDFAYHIHSAVGNKCVGARVSGKMVPLHYRLQTGDIVEIITSPASHGPSRDWLKIVKTQQAKSKIRQWFKKEHREENIAKGRDMLEKEAKRQVYDLAVLLKPEFTEKVFKKFTINTLEDMYAAIGYGGFTTNQVLSRLIEEYKRTVKAETKQKESEAKPAKEGKPDASEGVNVEGEPDMLVRFARCCNPVPGDDIAGYITRGRGVSIHRTDCSNFKSIMGLEDGRLIDVSWAGGNKQAYNAQIQILAEDKTGVFAALTQVLASNNVDLYAVNARTNNNGTVTINFTVAIQDASQVEKILQKILAVKEVIKAHRVSA